MKKNFMVLAGLLACFFASAQTLAVNETDRSAGSRFIKTSNLRGAEHGMDDSVVKKGVVFFSAGYQSTGEGTKQLETYYIELDIVHHDNRLGCLEQNGRMQLILDDGTRIDCFQISDTDCDPKTFLASFALMPKGGKPEEMKQNFEKLLLVPISRIDIFTSEKKMVYKIKNGSSDYMRQHFALIDKTVKGSSK